MSGGIDVEFVCLFKSRIDFWNQRSLKWNQCLWNSVFPQVDRTSLSGFISLIKDSLESLSNSLDLINK